MEDRDVYNELVEEIRDALYWIFKHGELEASLDRISKAVDYHDKN